MVFLICLDPMLTCNQLSSKSPLMILPFLAALFLSCCQGHSCTTSFRSLVHLFQHRHHASMFFCVLATWGTSSIDKQCRSRLKPPAAFPRCIVLSCLRRRRRHQPLALSSPREPQLWRYGLWGTFILWRRICSSVYGWVIILSETTVSPSMFSKFSWPTPSFVSINPMPKGPFSSISSNPGSVLQLCLLWRAKWDFAVWN